LILAVVLASVIWDGPKSAPWPEGLDNSHFQIIQGDPQCKPFLTARFKNTPVHGSEDFSLFGIEFRLIQNYEGTADEVIFIKSPGVEFQTKEKAPLEYLRVPENQQGSACLVMSMG